MNKEFVSYQIALKLKELGFKEQCFSFYDIEKKLYASEGYYKIGYNVLNEEVIAPLYQQVFRWFREKYGLEIILRPDAINAPEKKLREYVILSYDKSWILEPISEPQWWIRKGLFKTYEEAQKECIINLISIIKNQKK
jgi:hypothetical protein